MMSRFSCVVVPVIVFAGAFAISSQADLQDTGEDHTSKVQQLLEQRRDVLAERKEVLASLSKLGVDVQKQLIDAREDLLTAELELPITQERRIEILQARVENFKQAEEISQAHRKAAIATYDEVLAATSRRLQAEIDLERYLTSLESAQEQ